MQGKITCQLQQLRRRKELNSLPMGVPQNGIAALQPLSVNDTAIRRQGITNCTCPDSGQFLLANSAHFLNRMNNLAFTLSIQLRLKFPVMGSRTHCICGDPMDCLGDHVLICRRPTVRNKARNTAHASLSRQLLEQQKLEGNYYVC